MKKKFDDANQRIKKLMIESATNPYMDAIYEILGPKVRTEMTKFGYAVIKGNTDEYKDQERHRINGANIRTKGSTLHERVLIINEDISRRRHPETEHEFIKNIGENPIHYVQINSEQVLMPGEGMYSVNGREGFFHGFRVEDTGLLYVVKAIRPSYVQGNSFRIDDLFSPKQQKQGVPGRGLRALIPY